MIMKKKWIFFFCCLLPIIGFSQNSDSINFSVQEANLGGNLNWLIDLNEKGLEISGDSIKTGKEFQKVLEDENYRVSLYPETYNWEQALTFIKKQELKQAVWFFINLYPENETNKEWAMKSILAYEKVFKMDEIVINSFYTYSFMDPKISVIKEGKPEIVHPDILEAKLRNVKEIVAYIHAYRKQQEDMANAK